MEIPSLFMPLITLSASLIIAGAISVIIKILQKRAEKTNTKLDDIILHAIGRPLYILVIVAGIYFAIHQTPYLADLMNKSDQDYKYRHFILTIFVTWIAASLAKRIIKEYGYDIAAKTEEEMDDRIVALADMTVTYIIWFSGSCIMMPGIPSLTRFSGRFSFALRMKALRCHLTRWMSILRKIKSNRACHSGQFSFGIPFKISPKRI